LQLGRPQLGQRQRAGTVVMLIVAAVVGALELVAVVRCFTGKRG
jgi:uncharacterized membrane protein YeaQ/YmgE (transglycosylase-associated protein family)